MQRIILHIDFDSFFASVEQQDHPQFRGKPLGVTAANGQTAIIAASREAKKKGVSNVCRTYEAKKYCPDLLLTRARFHRYWEISKQFIAICKDYSPYVEVFSIDELFLDISLTAHLFGGVDLLVAQIKQRITKEIGPFITVSVGISHNKLLAKLASGMKKPNGIFAIAPQQVEAVYKIAKLTDMCGIGFRIERRLNAMGIYTLIQLRKAPVSALIAEFGTVEGHFLFNLGQGTDEGIVHPFTHAEEVKSIGRNYCLPRNEYDKRRVLQNYYELCEEIAIKLRRLQKKARTVGFSMRGEHLLCARKTYSTYFDTGKEIFHASTRLIDPVLFRTGYIRQLSIWVSNLQDASLTPLSLFDDTIRREKLAKIIDVLNDKFGTHTIRNGFLLYADKLTTAPNGFMADRYERKVLSEQKISPSDPFEYTPYY
jgi:DNA polymerase IV